MQLLAANASAKTGLGRHPDLLVSYRRAAFQVDVLLGHATDAWAELNACMHEHGGKQLNQLVYEVDADYHALASICDLLDQCEVLVDRRGEELAMHAIRESLGCVPSVPDQGLISAIATAKADCLRSEILLLEW